MRALLNTVLMLTTGFFAASACPPPQPTPFPSPSPTGTPSPSPDPTPEPSPTATPPEACHFSISDVTRFKNRIAPNGGQRLDFTVVACGSQPPCNNPPASGLCCELSAEKGNQQCADVLYGEPWWTPDASVRLDNLPFGQAIGGNTHKVSGGDGNISICGSVAMFVKPGACVRLHVKTGVPACDLDSLGGCILQ